MALLIQAVLDHNGQAAYFPYEKVESFGPHTGDLPRYWMLVAAERATASRRGRGKHQ